MAGSAPPPDLPEVTLRLPSTRSGTQRSWWPIVLGLLSVCVPWLSPSSAWAWDESNRLRMGVSGRGEATASALLVDYFQKLIEDQDIEAFRDRVVARFTEETLCEILMDSPRVTSRRASVVSLGFLGGFARSNAALGRASQTAIPPCGGSPRTHSGPSGSAPGRPSRIGCSWRLRSSSDAGSSIKPRPWRPV